MNMGLSLGDEEGSTKLFSEVASEYLDTLEARDSTVFEYYRIIKNWWDPELGKYPIEEITGAKIKKILRGMNVSPKTKKNRLIPLFGVFKYAEVAPPTVKLKRRKKSKIERYTPKERDKVLKKLTGQSKVYFTVLFGCGLRPGEALGLRWDDYDGQYLRIERSISKRKEGPTKTDTDRKCYVPKWVKKRLDKHKPESAKGAIFKNTEGRHHLDTDMFNKDWKKAHEQAKVPYRVPYVCRHTRAAELLSQGAPIARAAKQLGHSVQMFLDNYSEFIEDYADQDMSAFEGVTAKKR